MTNLQRLSETSNEMLARLESAVNEDKAVHGGRIPRVAQSRFVRSHDSGTGAAQPAGRSGKPPRIQKIVAECGLGPHAIEEDMLTLARRYRAFAARVEPVDLVELLRASASKATLLAGERGHTLTMDFDSGGYAAVLGDYAGLHRLLWILVDNATKYTAPPESSSGAAGGGGWSGRCEY